LRGDRSGRVAVLVVVCGFFALGIYAANAFVRAPFEIATIAAAVTLTGARHSAPRTPQPQVI
jgi:hypothetical protein